jgi:lipopolysaccharide/colanic/teichoic acid biosynthesis glycosyltransferase
MIKSNQIMYNVSILGHDNSPASIARVVSKSACSKHTTDVSSEGLFAQYKWHFRAKRCLDVLGAFAGLLILAPVLLLIAMFIRMESKGSPLFSQLRWGRGGKKIRVYKFRSMRADLGDPSGVRQTIKGDTRITRVGAILRKTNLDELPQLINVLNGDMSLVGPRCHAIGMLAGGKLYEELVPNYQERHIVRPGLTGLAQMRGLRGPTDNAAKARARVYCDLYYIRNFSFVFDLRILVGTIVSEFKGGKGF